jgi:hypothetical protein
MPFIGSDLLYKAGLTVNINVYTIMMYCFSNLYFLDNVGDTKSYQSHRSRNHYNVHRAVLLKKNMFHF